MTIVKSGYSRLVFVFDQFVIKVPRLHWGWDVFKHGLFCNRTERIIWKHYKSEKLCPVLYSSLWGFWLVMRKAECNFSRKHEFVNEEFPGDDLDVNYGYLDGRLVKIDYGNVRRPNEPVGQWQQRTGIVTKVSVRKEVIYAFCLVNLSFILV